MSDPRLQLRPVINTAPTTEGSLEHFQNHCLRPVLKLQNELLLGLFRHFLKKRKVMLEQLSVAQRHERIANLIGRDNRLRSLLFGAVIGQFTEEELTFYLSQESEINRRLSSLLTERFSSQQERL